MGLIPGLGRSHSSVLAWRIPGTEEAGGLPSMGSRRGGRDSVTDTFTVTVCQAVPGSGRAAAHNPEGACHGALTLRESSFLPLYC